MEDQNKRTNIAKFSISGLSDEHWNRLEAAFLELIGTLQKKAEQIQEASIDDATSDETSTVLKDMATIAANWAKAKVQRTSLENEKIKAEITEGFTRTKQMLVEIEKTKEETRSLQIQNDHSEFINTIEKLEKMFSVMMTLQQARILFSNKEGENAKLFIGAEPRDYTPEQKEEIEKDEQNDSEGA